MCGRGDTTACEQQSPKIQFVSRSTFVDRDAGHDLLLEEPEPSHCIASFIDLGAPPWYRSPRQCVQLRCELSGREQHTDERRAERGEQSERGEDATERGPTPHNENVPEGRGAGHGNEDQLHEERGEVAAGLIGDVHREQVPNARDNQKGKRRPSDELEATGDRTRGVDATEPANHRYDTGERDLSADPNRRAKNVQEESDRRDMYGQHESRLGRAQDHGVCRRRVAAPSARASGTQAATTARSRLSALVQVPEAAARLTPSTA